MSDFVQCRQAAKVVGELQEWIENHPLASTPIAHFFWSTTYLEIEIGDIPVWNSEENTDAELTFEFCRAIYLEELSDLLPFFEEASE